MTTHEVIAPASIQITPFGVQITGVPTVEQWGEAFVQMLQLGSTGSWGRTDLLYFAETEQPYGDDYMQFVTARRVSAGTLTNDRRRYRRFPPAHPLRRLAPELSVSHFDAAAPLSDDDAETVLTQACAEDLGRDWVRDRVREIKQMPPELRLRTTARFENGVLKLDQLENWITEGGNYEVTIRPMKKAA